MDTRDIRCFRLVYEAGSINKAAGQLFITPQGLSRIIRNLESELQVELFARAANGTTPTDAGHYFYAQSEELLYGLEQLSELNQYDRELQFQWDELESAGGRRRPGRSLCCLHGCKTWSSGHSLREGRKAGRNPEK